MKTPSEKSLYPHVKSFRINELQQAALMRLRGPLSEADYLRRVLEALADGTMPIPEDPVVLAVEAKLHRTAAFLIAWQADLELEEAERIVESVLKPQEGGPSS